MAKSSNWSKAATKLWKATLRWRCCANLRRFPKFKSSIWMPRWARARIRRMVELLARMRGAAWAAAFATPLRARRLHRSGRPSGDRGHRGVHSRAGGYRRRESAPSESCRAGFKGRQNRGERLAGGNRIHGGTSDRPPGALLRRISVHLRGQRRHAARHRSGLVSAAARRDQP